MRIRPSSTVAFTVLAALTLLVAPPAGAQSAEETILRIAGRPVRLDAARMAATAESTHAVVAFTRIPTKEDREVLARVGVLLHQYLPDRAFFATVPAGRGPDLLDLPFVEAAEPFRPEWKAAPEVVEDPGARVHRREDGLREVSVYFFPDTPVAAALEVVGRLGGTPLHEGYEVNERIAAAFPEERVADLLREDAVRWIEDARPLREAFNREAAREAGVDEAQAAPFNLTGRDVRVGIMDEDHVQTSHPDFGGRVTRVETYQSTPGSHCTHVAGTILGSGSGYSPARGMAPLARAWTWAFYGDIVSKKRNGFSNYSLKADSNSWGSVLGWRYDSRYGWLYYLNSSRFGKYEAAAADLDSIAIASGTLVNFAAGNDGQDWGGTASSTNGHYDVNPYTGAGTFHYASHPPDGGDDGYGCASPDSAMKNGLCVASMTSSGMVRSKFSSNGPAADGRIKPDITAVGESVTSTVPTDTWGTMSGTSMATPVVTGVTALVIEAWRNSHSGADPRLDALKGLLLHTAKDIDRPGPDYNTGFGAVDAHAAVTLATADGTTGPYLATGGLGQSGSAEHSMAVSGGGSPLVVTLCWTDRPGNPAASRALVNDLDLVLKAPSGTLHYPFRLNPASPGSNATRGVNSLDNVEKAVVESPESGTWTVIVRGTTVPSGTQDYAVWLSSPSQGGASGGGAPVADPGGDVTVSATSPNGARITLDGSASTGGAGSTGVVSWEWDLDGDGSFADSGGSATGAVVQVLYPVGSWNAALRVTDSAGGKDSRSFKVTVTNEAPVCDLGPDRTWAAVDSDGIATNLDTSLCTDPQTPSDVVAWDWDLDADGAYDDASGSDLRVRIPVGSFSVGLRMRDTRGLESTDRYTVTVVRAENDLPGGGKGYGTLYDASDRDTFRVEVLEGGSLAVELRASFPYRLTVHGPDGKPLLEHAASTDFAKAVSAPLTGSYLVEVSASTPYSMYRPYWISLQPRQPSISGSVVGALAVADPQSEYPVPLLAGSRLVAKLKRERGTPRAERPTLELVAPDGTVLESARAGRPLRLRRAPVTGTYTLRVVTDGGATGDGAFELEWKGRAPRGRTRVRDREEPQEPDAGPAPGPVAGGL